MENIYYIFGKKQGTTTGYGRTKVTGEFAKAIDEALKDKKVIRARTLFSTENGNYQISEVLNFPEHRQITFRKLSK